MEIMLFAFLPDAESMMTALERYGTGSIGVVYDVANAHSIGEDLDAGFARAAHRLHTVHLSGATRSNYRHDPVGAGDVDFAQALAAARAARHRRAAVLEIISSHPHHDVDSSAQRLAAIGWDQVAS
jgi:deoxyribonuclease-4